MDQEQLTHPPAIAEHTTQNLAPLNPLLSIQAGNLKAESTIGAAFKERFRHYYNLEKRIRDSMIAAGYQTAMFIEGKQVLTPNLWVPGQWIPFQPSNPSERQKRTMNFTRFYTTNYL